MGKFMHQTLAGSAAALAVALAAAPAALASSHREAPAITETPKIDGSDFYMFRSYEPGRADYVTFIANYQPLQAPYGGPNYFTMDPDAIYEIHVDWDGDAVEDVTYQFNFDNNLVNGTGITLPINGVELPIALRAAGRVTGPFDQQLGETETYTLTQISGDRRSGSRAAVTTSGGVFYKPLDNVGNKTIPDYAAYAQKFIYTIDIPGCSTQGRVFAGQRAEAFAVNLGEIFDLVNLVPLEGAITQSRDNDDLIGEFNVTSLALEIPIDCLTGNGNGVIGAWTTASLPQASLLNPGPDYENDTVFGGAFVQRSRLSAPLVNELVIGLPSKNLFNAAQPTQDSALADFVTNPTLPAILDLLFRDALGAPDNIAPSNFPRNDLVAAFLTGLAGLNQQSIVTGAEMMRLNTGVAPTPQANQSPFGVVGEDLAGFPNGRRPGDDTVDIALRVVMGRLCHDVPLGEELNGAGTPDNVNLGLCAPGDAPVGDQPFTDGAPLSAADIQAVFPYLNDPIAGSPN